MVIQSFWEISKLNTAIFRKVAKFVNFIFLNKNQGDASNQKIFMIMHIIIRYEHKDIYQNYKVINSYGYSYWEAVMT